MKTENAGGLLVLILGAGFVAAALLAVWLIGPAALRELAFILVSALALAVVILAVAFAIRAYRKNDAPPTVIEKHFHDGTRTIERHTIDGRAPAQNDIRLLQLPAQPTGAAYPELLRAAFQAGTLRTTGGGLPGRAQPGEMRELGPDDWGGPESPENSY